MPSLPPSLLSASSAALRNCFIGTVHRATPLSGRRLLHSSSFSLQSGSVSTLVGSGSVGSAHGKGSDASFYTLIGVATDRRTGVLYVANSNQICKISPDGTMSDFAGTSEEGSVDAVGLAARFNSPAGLAVDAAGNVIVADVRNHTIRLITPAGDVTTLAGSGQMGSKDGESSEASFAAPSGVAVDYKSGNIYISDWADNRIRRIDLQRRVTTIAGGGPSWFSTGSTDGKGEAARFSSPRGITCGSDGSIFVADFENHKVRRVSPAGVVTTYAGTGEPGAKDGPASTASFSGPSGVAFDHATGSLFVTDRYNNKIRKITAAGVVSTLAGSGQQGFADAVKGAEAMFHLPRGLCVDSKSKYVIVTDTNNFRLRKVAI